MLNNNLETSEFSHLTRIGGYFLVIDAQGKIEFFSNSLSQALGPNQQNSIGKNLFEIVDFTHVVKIKKALKRVNGSPSSVEAFKFKAATNYYFDAVVTSDISKKGTLKYILNLHDVTKRIKQKENLAFQNDQLNSFIYKVSHDLKAPLKSMEGLINLSKLNGIDNQESLSLMNSGIAQLQNYITKLGSSVRENAREVEKIYPYSFLVDLIKGLKYSSLAQRMIINIHASDKVPIYTDAFSLATILGNLISNAIKYQNKNVERPRIDIRVNVKEKSYSIEVEDNGIGIKANEVKNIFKMFHRSTSTQSGTGMGLAIATEEAKNIAATLEVNSTYEIGSNFRLTAKNFTPK